MKKSISTFPLITIISFFAPFLLFAFACTIMSNYGIDLPVGGTGIWNEIVNGSITISLFCLGFLLGRKVGYWEVKRS